MASSPRQGPLPARRLGRPARRDRQEAPEPDAGLVRAVRAARSPTSRGLAGITEDEVMERVQYLLDKRIIREVTPIFDTRALGYSSMLVAAKVDAEQPAPRGAVHQLAPGRHAQLPAQPRVQPLVHARGRAGHEARPGRHARRDGGQDRRRVDPPAADAEAVQDPHGPRDGGRHRRAQDGRRGRRADGAGPDRALRRRHRGHQGHAGPDGGALGRLRPGRREARRERGRRCWRGWPRCRSAAGCAAWPRSSTTAARASPPTAWACGPCRTARSWTPAAGWPRSAASRHCYQRPTYADWPYSVFTMAHGRSKEECDAVLDAIAESTAGSRSARRCTRAPSSRRSGCSISRTTSSAGKRSTGPERLLPLGHALGRALPAGAARPPGRRELAGAGDARDRPRPDLHRARLRRRADRRRRQRLRRLRLLLGPADPRPRASGDPRGGRRGRRARARPSARRRRARSSWPRPSRRACRRSTCCG